VRPLGRCGHAGPLGWGRHTEHPLDGWLPEESGERVREGGAEGASLRLRGAHALDEATCRRHEDRRQQPHRDRTDGQELGEARPAAQAGGQP